jgi:tetratricopeptide (TPR) repeat protein
MKWYLTLAIALAFLAGSVPADEPKRDRDEPTFGALKTPDVAEIRSKAEAWLKTTGKADDAKFKAIWDADVTLIEKIASTLSLGDAEAAKLLSEARNPDAPAPTEVPAILKDKAKPAFFRQGLALAYGKALTSRKVYEEALEVFQTIKPEEAIDPAAYFFHKAVCEHALILKDQADASIDRLLVDVSDSPERYRMVAALMHFDMLTWQEKDLGWIARKMENIQRRLDLNRGGKQTQKIQKEVLVRLEEMIKEMENNQKPPPPGGGGGGEDVPSGGGGMPGGGSAPGSDMSSSPMQDTMGGTANGTGQIDAKRVKEIAEAWGKLPEKERAAALRDLTRTMPAKDRAVIEAYFRELQKKSGGR